jgi:hypothetical protein
VHTDVPNAPHDSIQQRQSFAVRLLRHQAAP